MQVSRTKLLPELQRTVEKVSSQQIPQARQAVLAPLISYIQSKLDEGKAVNLNFICTHNSRRSQLSQIWAGTAAAYYDIPANCYSGGVEVTAFNERAVRCIQRAGFDVSSPGGTNPVYSVSIAENRPPINAFSKLFDDPVNKADQFAAVMTCSHADENCPFIPGTEQRIAVRYEDPKAYDDTPEEAAMYDARSAQIAAEMFYVFSHIKAEK